LGGEIYPLIKGDSISVIMPTPWHGTTRTWFSILHDRRPGGGTLESHIKKGRGKMEPVCLFREREVVIGRVAKVLAAEAEKKGDQSFPHRTRHRLKKGKPS